MATHDGPGHQANASNHVDIHETGLLDECPRCEEHADNPIYSLDDRMLLNLIQMDMEEGNPRSRNEAIALTRIHEDILIAKKIFSLNPEIFYR